MCARDRTKNKSGVDKMDMKAGILVLTLLVGSLAVPTPEYDLPSFFEDPGTRIVGGTQAAVGSHPHMAALTSGMLVRSLVCGGSLISIRTILTAAHCIDAVYSFGSLASTLRVTVGTNRWNSGGTQYRLARNVTHPHYVSSSIKNDIGVLITTTNVIENNLVRMIPLNYDYVGGGVGSRVAGWGRIRAGGALSATLLELELNTITGEECVAAVAQAAIDFNIRAHAVEPHIEICTFHSPSHGTCNGDSGSALVRRDTGEQIGLVSWGFPCARGAPDMFARVSGFRDWLQQIIV